MSRPNLRTRLAEPAHPVVATFVLLPRVEIVESLTYAGFDGVVLDLEHGPIEPSDLPALVAAGHGAGGFVLARLGDASPTTVGKVLDTGVDGIVVPHVGGADDARNVANAGRFPPLGERSLNPYVRAAAYDAGPGFTSDANDTVAILVMVEGRDGLANLDDILQVPGIDAVFVGPVDLSAALDRPGEPEHPEVVRAVEQILRRVASRGLAGAVYCPTPEAANRWLLCGARLVVVSADLAMAVSGFRRCLRGVTIHRRKDQAT
ncbi:MAG TPA: aldolase/citrate lyase family protein [Actinopolymorphaceae bacterium]|jgi:4-hydroxy-2-oxoheptanedioate aldolase